MAHRSTRILAAVVVVAAALAAGFAGAAPPAPNRSPVQLSPALFHPDLAVTLAFETSVALGVGKIKMHGQVCNQGNRAWASPPAARVESEYMVYTTHPPHTYAQEANLVFPGHQSIGTQLAVKQCVAHDLVFTVPNVSRWLQGRVIVKPGPGERLAQKQLVFRLNRDYPNTSNFPVAEDGNAENNSAVVELQYMERTP